MPAVEEEATVAPGVAGAVAIWDDHRLTVRVVLDALCGDAAGRHRPVPQARHDADDPADRRTPDQATVPLLPLGLRREACFLDLLLLTDGLVSGARLGHCRRAWSCGVCILEAHAAGGCVRLRGLLWR